MMNILPGKSFRICSAFSVLMCLAWVAGAAAQTPQWIWPRQDRHPNTTATWRKTVAISGSVQQAQLSGMADFCRLSVRCNGHEVAICEGLEATGPFFVEVTRWVHTGDNLLEVRAISDAGPAAVALRFEWVPVDGPRQVVVTDESWAATIAGEAGAGSAEPVEFARSVESGAVREFELDPQRRFGITALDDYEQWKQALQSDPGSTPSSFLIPPGYRIQQVRSATQEEGSWVSMAFDPRGRIVIGREDRGLLRLTLAEDRQSVVQVETINDTLLECRGLQFAHDSLYINANNSKGFYRLRDTNADDSFDDVQLLREFAGGVGHGRNDLTLGPDGMLYLIHGDSVELPKAECDDWTSPFREHRRGEKTSEGHLLRADREGRRWELLAAGLRNPYGVAFHADGEAFTYDADAEFDMGSPWYRPTQVKHLVPGGDFGWRGVTGRWPPYYPDHPDNALPSVHIGKGSPTSVKFGYGSHFPAPYREALFILDWAYGRIIAVHLTPRGASYVGQPETFLKGRPLNVTDLDFGPDGALYFVTGGRKTQAGLFRVQYSGPVPPPFELTVQQRNRQQHSSAARQVRRRLESLRAAGGESQAVLDAAWSYLDSPDPAIRYAARIVVERQPVETWRDRALAEERTTASLAALLALARSNNPPDRTPILRRLNHLPVERLTNSQLVAALHTYQLCLVEAELLEPAVCQAAIGRLDALYPNPAAEANRYLSQLLAARDAPGFVTKTMPLLRASTDQAEQLHYLFALCRVPSGWTPELRGGYVEAYRRSAMYLGGEGMPGFLRQIRHDFLAVTPAADRETAAALLDPRAARQADPAPPRPFVQRWLLSDLADLAAAARQKGNWQRGRRLFAAALCAQCHRVGEVGFLAGPDLTGAGRRFSRRDLLQSIVDPSLVVAENYHADRIVTTDGRVLVGRIVQSGDYRSTSLRLVSDPLQPDQFIEIAKREVESHTTVPISPMPSGLLDTLTREEIGDLLAFIESGGIESSGIESGTAVP